MEGMRFISCIRFSIQLFIGEGAFTAGWRRRERFAGRLFLAVSVYFLLAGLVFGIFASMPGNYPVCQIIYYGCLFAMSLCMMKFCFDI